MASGKERIDEQVRDVQHWRRVEDQDMAKVRGARRAQRAGDAQQSEVDVAEHELVHDRELLDAAEHKLDQLRDDYHKKDPLEKREDYKRDRVQDLRRENDRLEVVLKELRVEEPDYRKAYIEERQEAVQARGTEQANKEADELHKAEEVLVFTRKGILATERRLLYVRGLIHANLADLAKIRKQEQEAEAHIGGHTVRDRIVNAHLAAIARYYAGQRKPVFYSQLGAWTVKYGILGEHFGMRSDCSQWLTACHFLAGAPDPNGNGYAGGWTGSIVDHCHEISWAEAKSGDPMIVGTGSGHHVECLLKKEGDARRTGGHGSPPVDFAHTGNFSPIRFFRVPGVN